MLCSVDDYFLADGTLAGGYAISNLRLQINRIFDVVQPLSITLDHGRLAAGMSYKITLYESGDDFTNLGGTNSTGDIFISTGTTPTNWTNKSRLVALAPVLIDRNKRKAEITFNVQRVQSTITAADIFILDHNAVVPRTGDVKLFAAGGLFAGAVVTALIVNGKLISNELVKQNGKETEHSYHITGSLLFAPTPTVDKMLLETGDFILLETGSKILLEA